MKTRKMLLTALVLSAVTVPSVFATDVDGVRYMINSDNVAMYTGAGPDGTRSTRPVLKKELSGLEGIRLVENFHPTGSTKYDSGYIGGSSVIMRTVDTATPDTYTYAKTESTGTDYIRSDNGKETYSTRISHGGFTNTNSENKQISIMHGSISLSDYSTDTHDHDITLSLEDGLVQGDGYGYNGSHLTKDKLTLSKINGEQEYDDYGNDITKKFTAEYDLNGMTVANEHGNVKFTTSGINAGNQKIEGVATGVADTDAVNVKQLNDKIGALVDNDTVTTVTAGNGVTVTDSKNADGSTNYEVSVASSVTDKLNAVADNAVRQGGKNIRTTITNNEKGVELANNLQELESAFFGNYDGTAATYITKEMVGVYGENDVRTTITSGAVRTFDGSKNTGITANGINIENTDTLDQASFTVGGMQASDANGTVRFTTTNIDAGNQQIHGVKAGVADTDAVNVKQLKDSIAAATSNITDNDTITTVVAGDNIAITANGHEYTVSLDQATAKKIDDTAKGVADNAAAIKANADNIATNTANIIKAKSTVTAGAGVTVAEKINANGSTNYEVAIDQATMDKLNATADGINGLNGKVGENAKGIKANADAIDGLKGDVVKAKNTVTAGNGVVVNETTNTNGSTNYEVVVDKAVTDQIAANTDGINGLNGKVGENAKGIKDNADAIKANKDNIAINKAAIDELAAHIDNGGNNMNALNSKINDVQKESRQGIASASALAALHPLDYNPDHKVDVMAGVGHYRGKTAAAIGAAYRPNENVMFTIGTSINGKDTAINAGVSYKVGAKDGIDSQYSKVAMQNRIDELNGVVSAQNAKIDQLNNLVEKLLNEVQSK